MVRRHVDAKVEALSTITFRDAVRSDLRAIIDLLADDMLGAHREVLSDKPDPKYVAAFQEIEQQSGNRIIVAIDEGQSIAACLQLMITPGLARMAAKRATIEGVRVRSDMRGAGVGAALFEYAIEQARAAGCDLVQLTTDNQRTDARRFYESLGFQATHLGMKLNIS